MPDRAARGLLDTSVVIDLDDVPLDALPLQSAMSALSLAELAAGPHATSDPIERSRRQRRLHEVEARIEVLPFDERAARTFGLVYAAVAALGRQPRGRRTLDLLIASTAIAGSLPLYTRNASDLIGLEDLIEIRTV